MLSRSGVDTNTNKNTVDLDLVKTVAWEKEFVSLTYEDMMEIWDRLCAEDASFEKYKGDMEQLQFSILELCDKCQITYTDIEGGMPVGIYPICPAQVFMDTKFNTRTGFINFSNTYDIQVKKCFDTISGKAVDEFIRKRVP
mmetsp:Transcript_21961/g.32020  ORF Transcript_21961/g.32020 Transcript_21961/m.32020 type:complete len:141 (+) Transcript_21961:263-685(+)